MRMLLLSAAASLSLAGCTTSSFFGTSNPCDQAELAYAAFVTVSTTTDRITPTARRAAAAGMSAIREQCSDGDVSKVTLAKSVRAYVAALETWKQ